MHRPDPLVEENVNANYEFLLLYRSENKIHKIKKRVNPTFMKGKAYTNLFTYSLYILEVHFRQHNRCKLKMATS